jgi:hypothetical protein
MPQYAAKADSNQAEIVEELRARGYKVTHTHTLGGGRPDIMVGGFSYIFDAFMLLWVEIKADDGKLTEAEAKFFDDWSDYPVIEVRSAREIVEWFGARYE